MYPHHRILPYSSRLDDGRWVEHEHPGGAASVAGSARANETGKDPLLLDLASCALDLPNGGAVLATSTGARAPVDPPAGGGLALIGLRCPPETLAVAATAWCETRWPDGCRRSGALAWSVDRQGRSLAMFRERGADDAEVLSTVAGSLLDGGLRALGQPTAPCSSPTVWFPDGVFLQRVSRLLDERGALCRRRPLTWDRVSLLYPLNVVGKPLSACVTRHLRHGFHERNTWSSLRRGVVEQPASAPAILPGLAPAVADWLDDGSFARWVLSRVSDAPSTLEWLCGRVHDSLVHALSAALGDVTGPGGAVE
ncbi:MAG: hypothetical protein J4F50_02755 [Acidimicrobiia bacterium]|nr:hypothetical protein [Acidimicrobiia bacterium]